MESIDISLSDLEPISIDLDLDNNNSGPSNIGGLGPGIELLMNEKKKPNSGPMNIDLGELDKLENELNELSNENSGSGSGTKSLNLGGIGAGFANFFGLGGDKNKENKNQNSNQNQNQNNDSSNIGHATANTMGNQRTWDGFSKMANDVPMNAVRPQMDEREKRRKKRAMLKKLDEWYEKGQIKHSSNFNMESSFEEVEDEYETALEDKRKKDSIKLQGWWFMTAVNSLEYANSAFNPFDINLDGWGEQVSEDIDSYDEIFVELYDKYKGGKLAPELSLLLRLGFSAAMVNFTNKALSTAAPGFADIAKQNPEIMRMFTSATANVMSQNSPGFAMANNLFNESNPQNQRPNPMNNMSMPVSSGPPPAPVDTRDAPNTRRPPIAQQSYQNQNERPDISMARGAMLNQGGIDLSSPYENPNTSSRIQTQNQSQNQSQNQRPEMRGPQNTDIDNILAGLKTRTVDIHSSNTPPPQTNQSSINDVRSDYGDDSMVSVSSLRELDMEGSAPKKSRRRKGGSERNTISLDI
jgi:hypothetical protein